MPSTTTHGPLEPFVGGAVPGAPTGVVAAAGNGQVTVSWLIPANGGQPIKAFTVQTLSGLPPLQASVLSPLATSLTVLGLVNGVTYTFAVEAQNAVGWSAPSAVSNAVTPLGAPNAAPTAPVASPGVNSASVAYTAVAPANNGGSNIDAYRVTPYITGVAQPGLAASGPTSPIVVSGLTTGTTYTFTVAAHNAVGYGPESVQSNGVIPTGANTVPSQVTGVTLTAGPGQLIVNWATPFNGGSAIIDYTVAWS